MHQLHCTMQLYMQGEVLFLQLVGGARPPISIACPLERNHHHQLLNDHYSRRLVQMYPRLSNQIIESELASFQLTLSGNLMFLSISRGQQQLRTESSLAQVKASLRI